MAWISSQKSRAWERDTGWRTCSYGPPSARRGRLGALGKEVVKACTVIQNYGTNAIVTLPTKKERGIQRHHHHHQTFQSITPTPSIQLHSPPTSSKASSAPSSSYSDSSSPPSAAPYSPSSPSTACSRAPTPPYAPHPPHPPAERSYHPGSGHCRDYCSPSQPSRPHRYLSLIHI